MRPSLLHSPFIRTFALGTLVVVEAEHMCMTARGIKKPGSLTITSAVRGSFKEDEKTRAEALSLFIK